MADATPATETWESVSNYYGQVLKKGSDLKTSAACCSGAPHPVIASIFAEIPKEVIEKFYGCGAPLPLGVKGLRFLDLGSGSGRDCFAAAALVGEDGRVTGVDMTREQLAIAQKHAAEYCTRTLGFKQPIMDFVEAKIEYLAEAGIAAEAYDICMSNCVVNLSPDKPAVLRQVYRALAPGGEFYFSDVYTDTRLSDEIRKHHVLWGECLAGALQIADFEQFAVEAGFCEPRILSISPIEIYDAELRELVGEARFFSITYRLFKLEDEAGQGGGVEQDVAVSYSGTIEGMEAAYALDLDTKLVQGEAVRVDAASAAIIQGAWLKRHFEVLHRGAKHFAKMAPRRWPLSPDRPCPWTCLALPLLGLRYQRVTAESGV
jgi:arsenite methyltransferase